MLRRNCLLRKSRMLRRISAPSPVLQQRPSNWFRSVRMRDRLMAITPQMVQAE